MAGGIKLGEVGIEFAVACALYSARTQISFPAGMAVAGEISLAGELLPTPHMGKRIKTASEMGFKNFAGPGASGCGGCFDVSSLKEGIKVVFGSSGG